MILCTSLSLWRLSTSLLHLPDMSSSTFSSQLVTEEDCSISTQVSRKVKEGLRIEDCDLNTAEDQMTVVEDGLLIRQVSDRSNKTFICRAVVPETGELQEREINLIVSCKYWEDTRG